MILELLRAYLDGRLHFPLRTLELITPGTTYAPPILHIPFGPR